MGVRIKHLCEVMYICMCVSECEFVRAFITGIATAESVWAKYYKQCMYAPPCPAAQTAHPSPVLPPFSSKKTKMKGKKFYTLGLRLFLFRLPQLQINEQWKKRAFNKPRSSSCLARTPHGTGCACLRLFLFCYNKMITVIRKHTECTVWVSPSTPICRTFVKQQTRGHRHSLLHQSDSVVVSSQPSKEKTERLRRQRSPSSQKPKDHLQRLWW